jgi:hypothetical protein
LHHPFALTCQYLTRCDEQVGIGHVIIICVFQFGWEGGGGQVCGAHLTSLPSPVGSHCHVASSYYPTTWHFAAAARVSAQHAAVVAVQAKKKTSQDLPNAAHHIIIVAKCIHQDLIKWQRAARAMKEQRCTSSIITTTCSLTTNVRGRKRQSVSISQSMPLIAPTSQ